ncbi:unnamed protein product [Albugo candida]|uniref:NECAP PHear domain-containing protein n=1 Tax=Albugo candida TaxID=65357 RepID=A0A024G2M0_9STRA|nr:unnamed protein product [Albugo candida]|eukprot:CCI41108.1 unnamed protein product [Albugo candida]
MAEIGVKRILAVINQCFVFKIPPQVSAAGHRADSWPKEPVWTGRLTIFSCDEDLMIELRDSSNGSLFAACPMKRNGPTAVQKVVDSSRYFVLRVVDQNSGRHAFIGIAFENRSDAFDFNVALDDHQKELQREKNAADKERAGLNVTKDYSLKDGEKIKIKINSKKKNEHTDAETTDFNNGKWMEASSPNKNTASIESCGAQANTFAPTSSASSSDWESFF